MCSRLVGNDGRREQRALVGLSAAAHVASSESTMTGSACSFPVCASLVWAASAKSSPLMHARTDDRATTKFTEKRFKDNHLRSRHWPSDRCPRTEGNAMVRCICCRCRSPTSQPPHPRGLAVANVQLGSMLPASASFGLSRVSQGHHHRMRTRCLACEARVDT